MNKNVMYILIAGVVAFALIKWLQYSNKKNIEVLTSDDDDSSGSSGGNTDATHYANQVGFDVTPTHLVIDKKGGGTTTSGSISGSSGWFNPFGK